MRFFRKIRKCIIDPRSLGSRCIRGTEESFPRVDSSVPLLHRDPSDLGSMIRFRIFVKKHTLILEGCIYGMLQMIRLWLKQIYLYPFYIPELIQLTNDVGTNIIQDLFIQQKLLSHHIVNRVKVMHQSIPAAPCPPPPNLDNCRAFGRLVSPGGGSLTNLARPRCHALTNPGGTPWAFDIHLVSSETWRISEVKISGFWQIGLSSKG